MANQNSIRVLMTPRQKKALKKVAEGKGLNVSDYVRSRLPTQVTMGTVKGKARC